jgi:hypothetical protein
MNPLQYNSVGYFLLINLIQMTMKIFLHVKKLTVLTLLALFVSVNLFAQKSNGKQIIYVLDVNRINPVTGLHAEEPTITFFKNNGYTVHLFSTMNLSNATPEQLDSLDKADLVYLGRTVGSANLQSEDQRAKWNAIKAPVMTGNLWALRSNRAKWFDSETIGANQNESAVIEALIEKEDPVFGDLKGIVKFWTGPYNVINIAAATSTCNGTVLLGKYDDPIGVLFVRFQPFIEFYTGLNEMPVAERVFIGCSSDQAKDASGNVIFSYFGFSDEFKQVFLNEAGRLTGIFPKVHAEKFNNAKVNVYPNPVKNGLTVAMDNLRKVEIMDVSGRTMTSLLVQKNSIAVEVDHLNKGIYFLKATDKSGKSITKKIAKD